MANSTGGFKRSKHMKIKITPINYRIIIEYLIGIILVFISGTAYISTSGDDGSFKMLAILLFLLVCWYSFPRVKMYRRLVLSCIFVLLWTLVNCIIDSSTIFGFSLRMIWAIGFFLMASSRKYTLEKFLRVLYRIIVVISSISILAFIALNVFKYTGTYSYLANGENQYFYKIYYGFYCASNIYIRELMGFKFYRMQSIFWEPGVYACYLVYAIFYSVFYKEEINKISFILMYICLALTLSTTGICIGIALLFHKFVYSANITKKSKIILSIPSTIFAALIIVLTLNAKKVESSTIVTGSWYLRSLDIVNGLNLFIQKPIFGWGYKTDVLGKIYSDRQTNSNGLIILAYNLGCVGLITVLRPLFENIINKIKSPKITEEIVFSVIFILTNMSEPLIYTPLMIFMIMIKYNEKYIIQS